MPYMQPSIQQDIITDGWTERCVVSKPPCWQTWQKPFVRFFRFWLRIDGLVSCRYARIYEMNRCTTCRGQIPGRFISSFARRPFRGFSNFAAGIYRFLDQEGPSPEVGPDTWAEIWKPFWCPWKRYPTGACMQIWTKLSPVGQCYRLSTFYT